MQLKMSLLLAVIGLQIVTVRTAEALYLTIENIGQESIVGAYILADRQPFQDSEWDVALYSAGINQFGGGPNATDPSNIYLAFSSLNPIASGDTYISPLIPQLTGITFTLRSVGVYSTCSVPDTGGFCGVSSTANFATGLTPPSVIPDSTTYSVYGDFIGGGGGGLNVPRSSICQPNCPYGYILSFHAGGFPAQAAVPEPSTLILLLSGLAGLMVSRALAVTQRAS